MTIYKNLWAGHETYFIRKGTSGRYATGIGVVNWFGEWIVDFNMKYYASDLKHDKEHFPVIGKIDVDRLLIDAVKEIADKTMEAT